MIKFCVLTDHGDTDKFVGYRLRADSLGEWFDRISSNYRLLTIIRAMLFYFRAHRFKGNKIIVTYGGDLGFAFAFLQYISRSFCNPLTHVMFDLLVDDRRSGINGIIDYIKAHIFNMVVTGAVVWGKNDIVSFSQSQGFSEQKLYFHPYHITLDDLGVHKWDPSDDGYVFCGGNVGRDFDTVIQAFGQLGYPTVITTQVPGVIEKAKNFPNIKVIGVSPIEFRRLMSRCSFVVEAHPKNFFRTAGHQTMLNAMYFGKPVILVDIKSADEYVENGINGFVLAAEDVPALMEAGRKLWEYPEIREQLGKQAKEKATKPSYRTLNHMQSIYNLAIELHEKKEGCPGKLHRINIY